MVTILGGSLMVQKINEVVSLKKFKPVIEIKGVREDEKIQLFDDYIITEDIAKNFETIFEQMTLSLSDEKREQGKDINPAQVLRAFLLRGAYGTGKSYFLLTLATILEKISEGRGNQVKEKFKDFSGIAYHVDQLINEGNYFIVTINGVSETNVDFENCIRKNFISKCKEKFPNDDFIPKTEFENAIEKLTKDKEENSAIWHLISNQMEKMGIDYNQLVSGLRRYRRESFEQYRNILKETFGYDIDINSIKFDTFIKESYEYIKAKGYKGIIYIFDEFSAYLSALIDDGRINNNLPKIQELAELCHYSRVMDIIFIASIHKSLSILLKSVVLEKEELDKIIGRFNNEITLDFSKGNELIKDTLKIDRTNYQLMRNKYEKVKELEEITNGSLRDYYPLHPVTVDYLNKLSRLYAQENRTLFKFLSDVVDQIIKKEDIMKDGHLNIITMDVLYDYFVEDAYELGLEIVQSANNIFRMCKEEWQKKVIRALIVARMSAYEFKYDSTVKIGLSADDIYKYLFIKDSKTIDDFLQEISFKPNVNIYYDKENKVYDFIEGGSRKADIQRLIDQISKTINEYEELIKLIKEKGLYKRFYNSSIEQQAVSGITPVKREFTSKISNYSNLIRDLQSGSIKNTSDGIFIHLLPQYFEVEEININQIKDYMHNHQNNVVVLVPKKYDFNRESIVEYAAYKKLLAINNDAYANDERTRQLIIREISRREEILINKINEYTDPSNFYFIFNDELLEFKTYDELIVYILKKHYYKFPNIRSPISSGRLVTNRIINSFIIPKEKTIPRNSNAEEDRHIKETLGPIGLAKINKIALGDLKAELRVPTEDIDPVSAEIFNIVCNKDKDEIFNILGKAPYGLPDFLIELYIGCAYSLEKIYIYKGETLPPLSTNLLNNIRNKSDIVIKKPENDLDINELLYVKDFWKVISTYVNSNEYKKFRPEIGSFNSEKIKLMTSIANDVKVFLNIKNNIMSFEEKKLNFDVINKLIQELEKLNTIFVPEKYFKRINELPCEVVGNADKTKALKILEDNIIGIKNIIDNYKKYSNALSSCEQIDNNMNRFRNNNEIMNLYDEISQLRKMLLENPLKFNEIDKLNNLIDELINLFNSLYKKKHDELYEKILERKISMNEKDEVNLIVALEKFKFENILKLEDVNRQLSSKYPKCNNDFSNCVESKLYSCDCMQGMDKLEDFDNKYKIFLEEIAEYEKTLLSIIDCYRQEFIKLDKNNVPGKKTLKEFIKDKHQNMLKIYAKFMSCINDDILGNKQFIMENTEKLSEIVSKYVKYIEGPQKPLLEEISLDKLNRSIINGIKFSGKSRLNKEEVLLIVKDILDKTMKDKVLIIQ
jgi:hypothetical protein